MEGDEPSRFQEVGVIGKEEPGAGRAGGLGRQHLPMSYRVWKAYFAFGYILRAKYGADNNLYSN